VNNRFRELWIIFWKIQRFSQHCKSSFKSIQILFKVS
jgi:hypothetical protein